MPRLVRQPAPTSRRRHLGLRPRAAAGIVSPSANDGCRDAPPHGTAWLHAGIQGGADYFTHKVYDKTVEKGNLK